jgi:hypothetical protein
MGGGHLMIRILDRIRQAGGTVAVVGGDLRLRLPKGLLSAAERDHLAEYKAEVVRLLADEAAVEPVVPGMIDQYLDLDEEVVPPAPCGTCGGSLAFWWDFLDRPHCMACEPAERSAKIRQQAEKIRNRQNHPRTTVTGTADLARQQPATKVNEQ